jgi:hypothetical protein
LIERLLGSKFLSGPAESLARLKRAAEREGEDGTSSER